MSVEQDVLSDDARVGAETTIPETVAEYDNRIASGHLIFLGEKAAPEGGFDADHVKVVRACQLAPDPLGLAASADAGGTMGRNAETSSNACFVPSR